MTSLKSLGRALVRKLLPRTARRRLAQLGEWPPIGKVNFGDLRRVRPISDDWGSRRGLPIDRYYIEQFLGEHAKDIRGRVLEVRDRSYTVRFGGERVTQSDVLHKVAGNSEATIVGDLTADPSPLPMAAFDAIICTQTLQFIYDIRKAIHTLFISLKPGGVLLLTVPTITHISHHDMLQWGDYWRFTSLSARLICTEQCPGAQIEVNAYGNVLAAIASLQGIASNELCQSELDAFDPNYEFLITVRVVKQT